MLRLARGHRGQDIGQFRVGARDPRHHRQALAREIEALRIRRNAASEG